MLTGPLLNEPMRVETVRPRGPGSVEAGLVGQRTEQFRRVTLTAADIADLTIADSALSYSGDGRLLRLGLQTYALGIAHEFDPYFGLSVSRVDPLPHQLEAVYDYLLKLPSVRFLLADDAGAGKTIMAGLLIRELKLRGLAERVLVVCPANLTFQWQRELKEKFDEQFFVLKGGDLRDQFGVDQWLDQKQVVTSLDLAKREDILPGLRQVRWDLVIVDEAHRMSARDESHKSQRYRLGELLRAVPLAEYLEKVWEVVGREALQQVLGTAEAQACNGMAGVLEEDARLTALFLWTMRSTGDDEYSDTGTADEDGEADEEDEAPRRKAAGHSLPYDVVRRFAQPLGIHFDDWEKRIVDTRKGVVRLVPVRERAKSLFGESGADTLADRIESDASASLQLSLFPEAPPNIRGRARRRSTGSTPPCSSKRRVARRPCAPTCEPSQERGPDFQRLANALSALYPRGSEGKRLLHATLLAMPR